MLLVLTSSFCMDNSSDERERERQFLLEHESVEDVVARILSTPAELTDRDYYLHCGERPCCDCWQKSVRCVLPCAHDSENRCKLTSDERCVIYKWGGALSCLFGGFCVWGWATQGCPPWTAPH